MVSTGVGERKIYHGPCIKVLVSTRVIKINLCTTDIELTIYIKYSYFLIYKYNITSTRG